MAHQPKGELADPEISVSGGGAGHDLHEQLYRQTTYFENLFKDAPEGIIIADKKGGILRANEEFCRIFGFEGNEIIAQSLDSLIVPPDELETATSITRRVIGGEKVAFETVRLRRDPFRSSRRRFSKMAKWKPSLESTGTFQARKGSSRT
jgi:PAS domain-containing protein